MNAIKVCCIFLFLCLSKYTYATPESENQVLVQFDLVQLSDWSDKVVNKLKSSVAKFAEDFCKANLSACSMNRISDFSPKEVVIVSGYPRIKDVNTLVELYVTLPQSSSANGEGDAVLEKAVLAGIITENRAAIQHDLIVANNEKYEASYRVSFVDNVLVLEPSDQTLNTIIIPIACGAVAILSLVVVVLQFKK